MCVRFRGVWPAAPRVLLGLGAAPRVLLGLSAALVARCVWLGLAALLNVLRSRLDLPATIAQRGRLGLAALLNALRSIGWTLVV